MELEHFQKATPPRPRSTIAAFRVRPKGPEDNQAIFDVRQHFVNNALRSIYRAGPQSQQSIIDTLSALEVRDRILLVAESTLERDPTVRVAGVNGAGRAILGFAICGPLVPPGDGALPLMPAGHLEIYSPGPIRESGDESVNEALVNGALSMFFATRPYYQSILVETLFRDDIEELQIYANIFQQRGFERVGHVKAVQLRDGLLLDCLFLQKMIRARVDHAAEPIALLPA